MKEWWLNLSLKEKQTVLAGSVLVGIFLIYAVIWSPITNAVASLRDNIHNNQVLLSWMQETDKRIQSLEKNQQHTTVHSTVSLLSHIQTELDKTDFAKNAAPLQEAENDSIQLHLKNVNFDHLIQWLTKVSQQQDLIITEMSVKSDETSAIVDADIKLAGA